MHELSPILNQRSINLNKMEAKSRSLYEISAELEHLNEVLMASEGELTPEVEGQLAIAQTDLQTKGCGYGYVIMANEHTVDAIDAEIKRLSDKKKYLSNATERLKTAVSDAMQRFGFEKIETATIKLSFRKSESVEIVDPALIPEEFLVAKTTYTPDKAAIKSVIKDGGEVYGAVLLQKKNLQIK